MKLMKGTLSRLWRLTRATSIAVSLAVVVALVGGVVSQSVAAPSGTTTATAILKGVSNTASTVTTLVNSGTGEALRLEAIQTTQPALRLKVPSDNPPLAVNPEAGKAVNLEADKLDGKEATQFLGATEKAADSVHADEATRALKADEATKAANADNAANADKLGGMEAAKYLLKTEKADQAANADNAANADKLDGKDSTDFTPKTYRTIVPDTIDPGNRNHRFVPCDVGDLALSGGFAGLNQNSMVIDSYANSGVFANLWTVAVSNDGQSADEVELSAICADYGTPHQ